MAKIDKPKLGERKEFIVVCGDINADVDPIKSDSEDGTAGSSASQEGSSRSTGPQTRSQTPRQKIRRKLFTEFCYSHKLKIAEFEEGSLPSHLAAGSSKDSNLDQLAYGWIGSEADELNQKLKNYSVKTRKDNKETDFDERQEKHNFCYITLDMKTI